MAKKTISRETVINQSIEGTCSSIASIISHSSNEEFRNAVMSNFKVKDTVELKKKLSYKLKELGGYRFETVSQDQTTYHGEIRSTDIAINNPKEDSWSKLEQLLYTDDLRTLTSEENNYETVMLNKESVAVTLPSAHDVPVISNLGQTATCTIADGDEQCSSDDKMKSPDLAQIIEGVKKVSPFCQLAVESPSYDSYQSDHSDNVSDKNDQQVFPEVDNFFNLTKTANRRNSNSTVDTEFDVISSSKQFQKYHHSVYSQPISAINKIPVNSTTMTSHSQNVINGSVNVRSEILNYSSIWSQLKTQNSPTVKLTQESPDNNYTSGSPLLFNKRLKCDDESTDQSDSRYKMHAVDQVVPNGDEPKYADNDDDWFDNVLLDIEDWLN